MRFLIIAVADKTNNEKIGITKLPLFILSLLGKFTPEFVYTHILKKLDSYDPNNSHADKLVLKEIVNVISKVLIEASNNEQLAHYDGVIFESMTSNEKITVSIE